MISILLLLLLSSLAAGLTPSPTGAEVYPNGCSLYLQLKSDNVTSTDCGVPGNIMQLCCAMILYQTGNTFTAFPNTTICNAVCPTYQGYINDTTIVEIPVADDYPYIISGSGSLVTFSIGGCTLIYSVTSGYVSFLNVTAASGADTTVVSSMIISVGMLVVFNLY
jgi:hypothetical protein